jgi:2-keto-4-pentenoate hydratase/2-oxohepta-3-ene-1,7-dioic acid hydratase in catechol pathway
VGIPRIIAYASSVMRLDPGDVISTGAPAGVGQVRDSDVMVTEISRIGRMHIPVKERATHYLRASS